MAMQVTVSTIYRVEVKMGCGCRVYSEFDDPKCTIPTSPVAVEDSEELLPEKAFSACKKHANDASLNILQFMIEEMLEKEVIEAGKAPVVVRGVANAPVLTDTTLAGVAADKIQSMGLSNKMPKRDPLAVKQASIFGNLKTAGASKNNQLEIDMEGVPEDDRVTDLAEETLGFLMEEDPRDGSDRR